MQYSPGYGQEGYAGYQGYNNNVGQAQTYQANGRQFPPQRQQQQQQQQQHPMVVIPQEPRQNVAHFQTSSLPSPYHPQQQPAFYQQQYSPQWGEGTRQHSQYLPSQLYNNSQAVQYQHPLPYQSAATSQLSFYTAPSQQHQHQPQPQPQQPPRPYQQPVTLPPRSFYASEAAAHAPHPTQPSRYDPVAMKQHRDHIPAHVLSSPDPLQTSAPPVQPRVHASASPPQPDFQLSRAQQQRKPQLLPQVQPQVQPQVRSQVQPQAQSQTQPQGQSNERQYQQPLPQPPQQRPQPPYQQSHQQLPQQNHQRSNQQSHQQPAFSDTSVSPNMPKPRVVAHVAILTAQSRENVDQIETERTSKRRRSNEGHAVPVPVSDPRKAQKPLPQQHLNQLPVSSPLTELSSSQVPPTPKPNVDYQTLLLALADEYTATAYGMSTSLATTKQAEERREEYYQLLATAMGCLESVLNNYRQSDHRIEARLRLRLAALMVEETENDEEAEQVLGKGIALCERSRLLDLKYAMHHLLIRLTFKTSPKAALKAIDKLVQEAEALQLTHWLYCFRFLRVSLTLRASPHGDTNVVLKHLAALAVTAEGQRDVSVQIIVAIFESLVHLRSGADDAVELAQRALAAARTHQLSPQMQQMPQISALMECLDLSCELSQFKFEQMDGKLQQMHAKLDTLTHQPGWNKDGTILVELSATAGEELEKDTGGILRRSKTGQVELAFQWINKSLLYALAYALSGFSRLYKNAESSKAEAFFTEGLKLCKRPLDSAPRSLDNALHDVELQVSMNVSIQLQVVFSLCARFEWVAAQEAIHNLRQEMAEYGSAIVADAHRTMLYLEAVCKHGVGELQEAVRLYSSPELVFEADVKMTSDERDLRALAALNSIFILRTLGASDSAKADGLLSAIEPYCQRHSNLSIKAAYYTIKATGQGPAGAIMKTKQHLQVAIDAAKGASNNQLLSIVMGVMTGALFTNIIGDQAEKSARTAVTLARKARHPLWTVVADGMYGNIMERCGKPAEAQAARNEARNLMSKLPKPLADVMQEQGSR